MKIRGRTASPEPTPIPKPDLEKTPKAVQFYNNLVQLDHEIALCKRLPEMRTQEGMLKTMRETQERFLKAAMAGFDPYNKPPSNWYSGFLIKPVGAKEGYRLYKRALPGRIIDAYIRAKELGVFDCFEIWSTDTSVFHDVPAIPKVDPIMIGWIGKGTTVHDGRVSFWESPSGPQAFLIGQWDLGNDLVASGLLALPEAPAAEKKETPKTTTSLAIKPPIDLNDGLDKPYFSYPGS